MRSCIPSAAPETAGHTGIVGDFRVTPINEVYRNPLLLVPLVRLAS